MLTYGHSPGPLKQVEQCQRKTYNNTIYYDTTKYIVHVLEGAVSTIYRRLPESSHHQSRRRNYPSQPKIEWVIARRYLEKDGFFGRGGMAQNGRTRGGTFNGEIDCCRERQGWCWFARPCCANLYPPGVWFADAMTSFSGVAFVLFYFVFVFILS